MSMFEIYKPSFQDRVYLFDSLHLNPSSPLGLLTNGVLQFLEAFLAHIPSSPLQSDSQETEIPAQLSDSFPDGSCLGAVPVPPF